MLLLWSGRRESNSQESAWEADAIPLGDSRIQIVLSIIAKRRALVKSMACLMQKRALFFCISVQASLGGACGFWGKSRGASAFWQMQSARVALGRKSPLLYLGKGTAAFFFGETVLCPKNEPLNGCKKAHKCDIMIFGIICNLRGKYSLC